jgi:peptidyl-prolyl cis-trans isomerase SurA
MSLRFTVFALFLLAWVGLRAQSASEDVLDRIAVTVNGRVILLSDWEDELRYESFMSGRQLGNATIEERNAALNHLVDQELLREQMRAADAKPIPAEQIQRQLETVKAEVLHDNPASSWQQVLSKYRLSENFIRGRITTELQQFQLVDSRFRPSIQVSQAEIEQYYKDQLVPKLPVGDPVNLSDATPKIREILVQNKMNQMLSSWLESLRSQAQIKIFGASVDASSGPPQVGSR